MEDMLRKEIFKKKLNLLILTLSNFNIYVPVEAFHMPALINIVNIKYRPTRGPKLFTAER